MKRQLQRGVQTTEFLYGSNQRSTMFLAWGLSLDPDLASVHNGSIFADSQLLWMRIQLGIIGPPRPEPFPPPFFFPTLNPCRLLNMIDF